MPLPVLTADPLEVKLAFQTIACRTCHFFWPAAGGAQPYGPYSTFDFEENYPVQAQPAAGGQSFSWAAGLTAEPGFPQPEIMDGCRKAPIMTIGINPNLTSFFPGPTGASWCYPGFQSLGSSDPSVKYAYYYRYRSVYQEHFDNDPQFIAPYLQKTDAIVATADGKMGLIKVSGLEPPIEVTIDYTGQSAPVITKLNWAPGTPPYVILFSTGSDFEKGDILAAKLDVMAGVPVNVERQVVGYYEQFVPVLDYFNAFLQSKGINGAAARMGEDVCQLDMVACASPHWTPAFLGGTVAAENEVITNCVTDNAWVIKQLVQTKPAVLYIVGESSFDMFRDNLGNFIQGNQSLDTIPADGAFTLLRQTTDPANPVTLQYQYSAGGNTYSLSTRLVISPHFSFNYNFVPQFRFSPADLEKLEKSFAACYQYLTHTPGISQGQKQPGETYSAFLLSAPAQTLGYLEANFSSAFAFLESNYYDPHLLLSTVLNDLYSSSQLAWVPATGGSQGYLARNEGSCSFCVNSHWSFPKGCPYQKNTEPASPPGFLESVAADMVAKGKPSAALAMRSYAEPVSYAADGRIII